MRLVGTRDEIMEELTALCPSVPHVLASARTGVVQNKRQIEEFQAAALYVLTHPFYRGNALEIGTFYGYSTVVLAHAVYRGTVTTLNNHHAEVVYARERLGPRYKNVTVLERCSWEYLEEYEGPWLDVVFVDGDHNRVRHDLPWFNWLNVGGLMLFHDYTPLGAPRHCPPVYEALNEMRETLGHGFDVRVIDNDKVGMVGFYRKEGETWEG